MCETSNKKYHQKKGVFDAPAHAAKDGGDEISTKNILSIDVRKVICMYVRD